MDKKTIIQWEKQSCSGQAEKQTTKQRKKQQSAFRTRNGTKTLRLTKKGNEKILLEGKQLPATAPAPVMHVVW